MQEALSITLELARADETEDPFAFKPRAQDYIMRLGRGVYRTVSLNWKKGVMADLMALRELKPDPAVAQRMGNRLREFLVEGGWEDTERDIREAIQEGRPVRVTVLSGAAELYALPWELLTVAPTGERLAQLPGLLIQYEWPGSEAAQRDPADDSEETRVLFAWSAAGGAVAASAHKMALEEAVGILTDRGGEADVLTIPHVTREALAEALERAEEDERPFRYLHIVCHGIGDEGTVGLAWNSADDDGADFVDPNALQAIIGPYADTLEAVVLMACHAGSSGELDNRLGSVALAMHRGSLQKGGVPMVFSSRTFLRLDVAEMATMMFYGDLFGGSGNVEDAFITTREAIARHFGGCEYAWLQLHRHDLPEADRARASDRADAAGLLGRLSRRAASAVSLVQVEPREAHRALAVAVTSFAGEGAIVPDSSVSLVVQLVMEEALKRAKGVHGRQATQQWSVHIPKGVYEPDMLGAAAAVASIAGATGRDVPAGWAFVGGFDAEGELQPVRSLKRRLDAAAGAGLKRVGVLTDKPPKKDHTRPGLTIVFAPTLLDLAHAVWPPRERRRLAAATLALAVTPFLAAFQVTDALDLYAQAKMLSLINGELPARNTVVIPAPYDQVSDYKELRERHGPLIDKLVAAGVRSIAFDVSFATADEQRDPAFAAAAQRAQDAGVPVVLAARWGTGGPKLPGTPALAEASWPGVVLFESPNLLPRLATGRMVTRKESTEHGTIWSLGVSALHARTQFATEPRIEPGGLVVTGQLHPTDTGRVYLHPTRRSPIADYDDPASSGVELRDKVVFVGGFLSQDSFTTPWGDRYGVELHAALVETLAAGAAPRRVGRGQSTLLTLLSGGGAVGVSVAVRDRRMRWLALLVPFGGLIWVLARTFGGVTTDLIPILFAGVAGALWGIKWHDWRLERFGVVESG